MIEMFEKRFAMFCGQRTGSTSIWLFLKAILGADILHEPFNPGRFDVKQTDVAVKLEDIYREYIAFKHIHEHLPREANGILLAYCSANGVPVLFLRRKDLVRRAISRELAMKTGHWMKYPERKSEYRSLVEDAPLSIEAIEKQLKNDIEEEAIYSDMLKNVKLTVPEVLMPRMILTEAEPPLRDSR